MLLLIYSGLHGFGNGQQTQRQAKQPRKATIINKATLSSQTLQDPIAGV
jgi:hypothetical protein